MDTAGLRQLLLGEPRRILLNALLLGSFAAIPIVWLAEMLREHFVTSVFWAFLATACLVLVATAILLGGGLLSAILAVFPVVSLAIFAGVLGFRTISFSRLE